jgi:hypothetical protein
MIGGLQSFGRQIETGADIERGDDAASHVDDPFQDRRRLGKPSDAHRTYDFANISKSDAESFVPDLECQELDPAVVHP